MFHRAACSMVLCVALIAPGMAIISTSRSEAQTVGASSTRSPESIELEKLKFEFEKGLEANKLAIEREKMWITGGSLLIPLLLGVITLAWQSWTTAKQKERDASDAFELKAAEIIFKSESPLAARNIARAIAFLYPNRLPKEFAKAFDPKQFTGGGARYEAKLEVFKAACAKVQTPDQVYNIWFKIFPGDEWIKPLVHAPVVSPAVSASETK
jgi:hypothetical protein